MTQIVIILQIDLFEIFSETNVNNQENLNKKKNPALKNNNKLSK